MLLLEQCGNFVLEVGPQAVAHRQSDPASTKVGAPTLLALEGCLEVVFQTTLTKGAEIVNRGPVTPSINGHPPPPCSNRSRPGRGSYTARAVCECGWGEVRLW